MTSLGLFSDRIFVRLRKRGKKDRNQKCHRAAIKELTKNAGARKLLEVTGEQKATIKFTKPTG